MGGIIGVGMLISLFSLPASGGEIKLDFQRSRRFGAILVVARVNGKPAVLVVDTGSNRTILSPEFGSGRKELPGIQVSLPEAHRDTIASWGSATLQLNTRTWKNLPVVLQGQREVCQAFEQKIDGILGQDILSQFRRIIIDSKTHTILLED
jgi:hypothetical protein